jgi:P27 family predicted phage terminase small subunit
MKRGPKPTSAALKLLRGNPGKRPIVDDDAPQPDALADAIPDELTDDVARAEWTRAIVPAIAIGQVTSADRTLALAHCELFAIWRSQSAEAAGAGHVVKTGKHGYRVPSPVRVMASRTLAQLTKIDGELGFTPTSRSRVAVKSPGGVRAAVDQERAKFFKTSGRG